MSRFAYTLVEVLAVVAIAAAVAVVLGPSLARIAVTDPLGRTERLVRACDQLARQDALGLGGSWSVKDGHLEREVRGSTPVQAAIPAGCRVDLFRANDGSTCNQVVIDHTGITIDMDVLITADQRQARFRVFGLTGGWIEQATP